MFKKIHDEPLGGHLGFDKTFEKTKVSFYWPNYKKNMEYYIRKCGICASFKALHAYTKQSIIPIRADRPFQLITLNILLTLQASEDLYFSCNLSFFQLCRIVWIKIQVSEELAKCLLI